MERKIRLTTTDDWQRLKQVRLAALLDAPKAFGVSHETASRYTDEQWQERASSRGTAFWLAFVEGRAVGMVGAALGEAGRFNLIGLWLEPDARGYGLAACLVSAVKTRAVEQGHEQVFLDVAPENLHAVRLYQQQGFVFLDEWEALESHPQVKVRGMMWVAPSLQAGPFNQAND